MNATAAAIGDKDNEKHKKDMTIATQVSPIKNETKHCAKVIVLHKD